MEYCIMFSYPSNARWYQMWSLLEMWCLWLQLCIVWKYVSAHENLSQSYRDVQILHTLIFLTSQLDCHAGLSGVLYGVFVNVRKGPWSSNRYSMDVKMGFFWTWQNENCWIELKFDQDEIKSVIWKKFDINKYLSEILKF